MKALKKIIKVPNKPTALPMRHFCNDGDVYCWEDWKKDAKREYPVRYFLAETIPKWYRRIFYYPIRNFKYKIKCFFIKPHLLDLRQPVTGLDDYAGGYLDQCTKIVFANFNILCDYVNESNSCRYVYGTDDINKLKEKLKRTSDKNEIHYLTEDIKLLTEINAIHFYWVVSRKREMSNINDLLDNWVKNKSEHTFKAWQDAEKIFDKKEEEMLIRLIKIRKRLWV